MDEDDEEMACTIRKERQQTEISHDAENEVHEIAQADLLGLVIPMFRLLLSIDDHAPKSSHVTCMSWTRTASHRTVVISLAPEVIIKRSSQPPNGSKEVHHKCYLRRQGSTRTSALLASLWSL